MNDTVIVFSSFYMAVYAQELLWDAKIKTALARVPANLIRSCGYALSLSSSAIPQAKTVLSGKQIGWKGIYNVGKTNGRISYRSV